MLSSLCYRIRRRNSHRKSNNAKRELILRIERLEDRRLLAADFYDSFENGLGDHWQIVTSAPEGRIAIRDLVGEGVATNRNAIEFARNGNSNALVFDTAIATNEPVLAMAILTADLSEMSRGILTFQHFHVGATQDSVPEVHQTNAPGKGLSVSHNGQTWYRLQAINGRLLQTSTTGVWQQYEFDLSQEFTRINQHFDAGLGFTSNVLLKFSSYDSRSLPQRGWAIDELRIQDRSDSFDPTRPKGVFHRFSIPQEHEVDFYFRAAVFGDANPSTPILVSVHGTDGDISFSGHPWNWSRYVDEHLPSDQSLIIVAPAYVMAGTPGRFNSHHSYAKLSWNQSTNAAADLALLSTVDIIAASGMGDSSNLRLWGYSGGGQFVGRFAAAHPDRTAAVAVGGPSSQIYPSGDVSYPYGFGPNPAYPPPSNVALELNNYLKGNVLHWIGQDDNDPQHHQLERFPSVDSSQGISRLHRALNQHAAMEQSARKAGIVDSEFNHEILIKENRGHGWSYQDIGEIYTFLISPPVASQQTPRIHSRIVKQYTAVNTAVYLPQTVPELVFGQEYFVELWMEVPSDRSVIEQGHLELFMDPKQVEFLAFEAGVFGSGEGVQLDSPNGRVRGIGGHRLVDNDPDANFELMGRVRFRTKQDSPINQLLFAPQRSDQRVFRLATGETVEPILLPTPQAMLRRHDDGPGIVQGEIFRDESRNGQRDPGEEGLVGRNVWLSDQADGPAVFITQVIDPDDSFGHGSYLTHSNPGVILTAFGPNVAHPGIIAMERPSDSSTGSFVFGTHFVDGGRNSAFAEGLSELRADFALPTNRVSIDVSRSGSRRGLMTAFNANNQVVATVLSQAPSSASFETMVIERNEADIAYVIVTGRNGSVRLDNLQFSSALMGFTDQDGYFRIHAVPPGQHFVNIQLEDNEVAGNFFTEFPRFETSAEHRVTSLSIDIDQAIFPPEIDHVDNLQLMEDFGLFTIALTGIRFSGGPSQQVQIQAFSSNSDLLESIEVLYSAPETTGTLRLRSRQDAVGSTLIRIVVTDGGEDLLLETVNDNRSTEVSFTLNVMPVNDPPQFEMESGVTLEETGTGEFSLVGWLSNIAPGPATAIDEWETQNVEFSVVGVIVPPGLMAQPPRIEFDHLSNDWPRSASLILYPSAHAYGVAVYDITATDDDPVDPRSTTRRVTITINPVNDPPLAFDRTLTFTEAIEALGESGNFTFSTNDLLLGKSGEQHSRPANVPPSVAAPFDESEQSLKVVAFVIDGQPNIDVANMPGGSGSVTRSLPSGGHVRFTFADGVFVSGQYFPPIDFNEHPVFGGPDTFAYIIEDDGKTTIPGPSSQTAYLPPERSQPARVTLRVLPTNDPPLLEGRPEVHLVERNYNHSLVVPDWATLIAAGPPTALDELLLQSVSLAVAPELSTIPSGLFHAHPQVDDNGTLTLFPAAHSFGSATLVIRATDHQATSGFVPRHALATVTVHVHPVNDPPRLADSQLDTSDSLDADHDWHVTSNGTIVYTLREDNTRAGGDTSEDFFIPLNALGISGYEPIGLLDIFAVGPDNEAQDIPGGRQTLQLADDFPYTTHLGGTLTLGMLNNRPGVFYRPPRDRNLLTDGIDYFQYTVTDDGQSYIDSDSFFTPGQLQPDPKTIGGRVELRLMPVNDPPIFQLTQTELVSAEGDGLVSITGWATGIQSGPDSAVDELHGVPDAQPPMAAQTVQFLITPVLDQWNTLFQPMFTQMPQVIFEGSVARLTFETSPHANGIAVFDVVLQDDGPSDATRGDRNQSQPVRFTITVQPVNDPPQFVPGNEVVVGVDRQPQQIQWATGVLPGPELARDELASQTVEFELTVPQSGSSLFTTDGQPTLDSQGILRFTPVAFAHGQTAIDVVALDSLGARSRSFPLTITLTEIIDPPLALNDAAATWKNRPVEVDVLANDQPPAGQVGALTVVIESGPPSDQGAVEVLSDGRVRFTPAPDYVGPSSFTYRAVSSSGKQSEPVTVTLTIAGSTRQNPWAALDVNEDGRISAIDALQVINHLNDPTKDRVVSGDAFEAPYVDVNGDGRISALDALLVINHLNSRSGSGEGEANNQLAHPQHMLHDLALLSQWDWLENRRRNRTLGKFY